MIRKYHIKTKVDKSIVHGSINCANSYLLRCTQIIVNILQFSEETLLKEEAQTHFGRAWLSQPNMGGMGLPYNLLNMKIKKLCSFHSSNCSWNSDKTTKPVYFLSSRFRFPNHNKMQKGNREKLNKASLKARRLHRLNGGWCFQRQKKLLRLVDVAKSALCLIWCHIWLVCCKRKLLVFCGFSQWLCLFAVA